MSLMEIWEPSQTWFPVNIPSQNRDEIVIDFDGNEVFYPRNEWYKIRLAYAMSIHKSQGSEFPVVILPITSAGRRMLERNLIYTAITRAKSKLILLGELQAFDYAAPAHRNCLKTLSDWTLQWFIETVEEKQQTISETATSSTSEQPYILTEENWDSIPAMIGITDADLQRDFWKIVHKENPPIQVGFLFINTQWKSKSKLGKIAASCTWVRKASWRGLKRFSKI